MLHSWKITFLDDKFEFYSSEILIEPSINFIIELDEPIIVNYLKIFIYEIFIIWWGKYKTPSSAVLSTS